jgi:hypothetical protein
MLESFQQLSAATHVAASYHGHNAASAGPRPRTVLVSRAENRNHVSLKAGLGGLKGCAAFLLSLLLRGHAFATASQGFARRNRKPGHSGILERV